MKGRRAFGPPTLPHQVFKRPMPGGKGGIGGRAGRPRGGEDHRFHQRQAAHQIGPLQRQAQRHGAAKGMADQVNWPAAPQPFGKLCRDPRGQRVQVALPVPNPGPAMARLVEGRQGHPRQRLRHAGPGPGMGQRTMQRQHLARVPFAPDPERGRVKHHTPLHHSFPDR